MNSAETCLAISHNMDYEASARDEDLVRAARGGSHAAFAELQKAYSHRIYRRILSITGNREDAEDALQDTFLSAYLALPSFEGKSRLSSWLTRIGINSALMVLRRRRRRQETSLEQQRDPESEGAYLDVRDDALDPEQLYDQQQRCHAIRSAFERLDPKSRAAMGIRVSGELSMKEIAERLGVSVATVKARLHRARKRLLRSPSLRPGRRITASRKKSSDPALSSSVGSGQHAAKCVGEGLNDPHTGTSRDALSQIETRIGNTIQEKIPISLIEGAIAANRRSANPAGMHAQG
jgi:RNA polymerase sigma-70 factor, ECF subfamily